jgi:hypothetical protein
MKNFRTAGVPAEIRRVPMHDPLGGVALPGVPLLISRSNRLSLFSGYKASSAHKFKALRD